MRASFRLSSLPPRSICVSCASLSAVRSELEALREEAAQGVALSEAQAKFLEQEDAANWQRPALPVRDAAGVELPPRAPDPPRESVYGKRLDEFAVSQCPSYRRWGALSTAPQATPPAAPCDGLS